MKYLQSYSRETNICRVCDTETKTVSDYAIDDLVDSIINAGQGEYVCGVVILALDVKRNKSDEDNGAYWLAEDVYIPRGWRLEVILMPVKLAKKEKLGNSPTAFLSYGGYVDDYPFSSWDKDCFIDIANSLRDRVFGEKRKSVTMAVSPLEEQLSGVLSDYVNYVLTHEDVDDLGPCDTLSFKYETFGSYMYITLQLYGRVGDHPAMFCEVRIKNGMNKDEQVVTFWRLLRGFPSIGDIAAMFRKECDSLQFNND